MTTTSYGAALNRAGAARNLRALVAGCDLDSDDKLRVGTRSLRVTAATLARRSGMSYSQIAEDVTDHVKAATAEIYVRHAHPFDESRTLELNGLPAAVSLRQPLGGRSLSRHRNRVPHVMPLR